MQLYIYRPDPDRYDALYLENSDDWTVFDRLTGPSLAAEWQPVPVAVYEGAERTDFPYLASHVPVFSRRAWQALGPLLGHHVEALELSGTDDWLAINVLSVIDALDFERADLDRFVSGGISAVNRYAFRPDVAITAPIFKVRGAEQKDVLVTLAFKERVEAAGLRGLGLKAVDESKP